MLFAEADVFWKPPNVYDVTGVAGFVIGVVSIWLSWWLAKRDIQKRLNEAADQASRAARDEVRRVARALLHSGVADTVRSLELAREACRGKRWPRAGELCELARQQLTRCMVQSAADEANQDDLRSASALIQDCTRRLRELPRVGSGELPDEVADGLDESIITLHRVDGRMTSIGTEADHA